jgi:hypothetical protein
MTSWAVQYFSTDPRATGGPSPLARQSSGKLLEAADLARQSSGKLREAVDLARDSSEKLRGSTDLARQSSGKLPGAADLARQSSGKLAEAADLATPSGTASGVSRIPRLGAALLHSFTPLRCLSCRPSELSLLAEDPDVFKYD